MDFRKVLSENLSIKQVNRICGYIGNDSDKFDLLMEMVFKDDETSARASWAAIHTADGNQQFLNPWIGKMIQLLKKTKDSSVKRNLLRLLENIIIPKKYRGELFETALKLLLSTNEPIAVRTFAITVLYNIAILHQELVPELKMVVSEVLLQNESAAIQSRGKKTLKLLEKIKN